MTEPHIGRLLLDEMLSGAIATQLRTRGVDVTAVVDDVALVSTHDDDLLAYATEHGRVLVTLNISDFVAIAQDWRAAGRTHHGLVYVANRTFPQNRSFVGKVTDALTLLCTSGVSSVRLASQRRPDLRQKFARSLAHPTPGTEIFLSRSPSESVGQAVAPQGRA